MSRRHARRPPGAVRAIGKHGGDDEAKAVAYHADASKVDAKKHLKYAKGQTCANCQLYAADGNKPSGGCALFYGKDVLAKAWCNAWEKKA